jgi:hypothetical protein
MEKLMKTLATLVAFATFIAAPAIAQTPPKTSNPTSSNTVIVGGQYVGQDPDAAIRAELRRDYHPY